MEAIPMAPLLWVLALLAMTDGSDNEIEVDFTSQAGYDRTLFHTKTGLTGGSWEAKGDGLRANLPTGRPNRQPSRFSAQVNLEGDFQIIAQYRINNLPYPKTPPAKAPGPSNNLEIVIGGKDLEATVFRDRRPEPGDEIGYFSKCPEGDATVQHHPFKGKVQKAAGRLGMRREGQKLTFLHGDVDGEMTEFGSTQFCTRPITEVGVQILALSSPDAVDITFDRLSIKADRLVRLQVLPPTGSMGILTWIVLGLVVAGVGALAYWYARTRRGKKPTSSRGSAAVPKGKSAGNPTH
jgi:hypothetical protein